jgi:hypothetical protein
MSNNTFNLENYHQSILDHINKGQKPDIKLNTRDYQEIQKLMLGINSDITKSSSLTKENLKRLSSINCILYYSRPYSTILDDQFELLLKNSFIHDEIKIQILNASIRHIIERSFSLGTLINNSYLETIKVLLTSKNLEIYFWCLHAIDLIGPRALNLFIQAKNNKPSIFRFYKKYYLKSIQHLQMIENNFRKLRLIK